MRTFTKLNIFLGWLTFIIATCVYTLTMEPTVSFWDCGEFISAANKLQIVHQPGAPLYLMIAKVLSIFASNTSQIAWWINFSSAIASGATIMFLFWTITHLAKKLLKVSDDISGIQLVNILGAGLIGALAYTFSDTFWLSAVEAEVYALSSLFTAVTFWAILKWENEADQPRADRWLVFIAYLIGLSIGVHLLNLLAIPAIGMVYYFKKINKGWKGASITFLISCLILVFIQYGIIPGTVSTAARFDLMFVNSLGLPFGSGLIAFIILLIGSIIWGIFYSIKHNKVMLNTSLLCLSFIYIGYLSYSMIVIRAKADTTLNNTSPDNTYSLLSYLNREQFGGENALLYGPHFAAKQQYAETSENVYAKGNQKYEVIGKKGKRKSDPKQQMFFPRIQDSEKEAFYRSWLGVPFGNPSFINNLNFFTTYQLDHMYWRYFMWNFAGRQNNIQGEGEPNKGNWLSGIKPIDAIRLGDQQNLPPSISENESYNRLYFLPLILGLAGLLYQLKRNKKDFMVVGLLFVFTGIAIIVYLNQAPLQPRERDYAYAASFYAFAIWIGLGVLAIQKWLGSLGQNIWVAGISAIGILFAVPVLMATQEWDDHDRSERQIVRDIAKNTLDTCAPNSILFVSEDNGTFPLWYVQEVENYRTDVRIVNLQLLGMGWYGKQLLKPVNKASAVKLSYKYEQFANRTRDYLPVFDQKINGAVELNELLDFIGSDNSEAKAQLDSGESINYLPTAHVKLTVNKAKMLANGSIDKSNESKMVDALDWQLNGRMLLKNQLLLLNIIANNIEDRPIYFHQFLGPEDFCGLDQYLQKEGMVYRVVPIKDDGSAHGFAQKGSVNTSVLYKQMMNYNWGSINTGKTLIDPILARNISWYRDSYNTLGRSLLNENKREACIKVLDKMEKDLPVVNTGIGLIQITRVDTSDLYYSCNRIQKANEIVQDTSNCISRELEYLYSIKKENESVQSEVQTGLYLLQNMVEQTKKHKQFELSKRLEIKLEEFLNKFGLKS